MKACCNSWSHRRLSLKGKVTVVNSLISSRLQYLCSILHTPKRVFEEVRGLIVKFVWSSRRSKISYDTLTRPIAEGGLNLADLETRVRVNLLQWVRRLFQAHDSYPALFLKNRLNITDLRHYFLSKPGPLPLRIRRIPFYGPLLSTWRKFHNFTPSDELSVRKEILWDNEHITDKKGQPLRWERWAKAGIRSLQDICHQNEDRLMSHLEIARFYGIQCTFLETLGLRLGIPSHWRAMLTPDFRGDACSSPEILLPSGKILSILDVTAKKLYAELVLMGKPVPAAQRRWDAHVDIGDAAEWNLIYLRPFGITRETKVQSLQFRVLHRTITCNHLLYRWRMRDDGLCSFCDQEDTLEHFFHACHLCREFWAQVREWIFSSLRISLTRISLKEFLLGVPKDFPHASVVNYALLWVKFFIHRQKLFGGGVLNLDHWIGELRLKLLTERRICEEEGKPSKFKRWETLLDATGD